MKSICVFCGAQAGKDPAYAKIAFACGSRIAAAGFRLIYGGDHLGLMGHLREGCEAEGGSCLAISPKLFASQLRPGDPSALITEDLRDRKARMHTESSAFLLLPGGVGSLDEFFEAWTLASVGQHRKALGIFNYNEYYSPLFAACTHMTNEGFISKEQLSLVEDLADLDEVSAWIKKI